MASSHINKLRGFSLTEVILSVALFSLISVSLVSAYVYVTQAFNRTALRSHAIDYAHEGVEAAALIAGRDMTNIPDGTYGLSYASNDWSLLGSSDTLGEYTRSITITSPTAESKRIVSTVNWKAGTILAGSVDLETYLYQWATSGGPGGPGGGGGSTWSNPITAAYGNFPGSRDGYRVQSKGNYAYVVRVSGNNDFIVIDISNFASTFITDTISIPGRPTDLALYGDYAIVTSTNNNNEILVIDVSDPANISTVDTLNLPGGANPNSVQVSGDYAFITRQSSGQDEFVIVDISDPTNISVVGGTSLASRGYDSFIDGSYAYVGTANNNQELEVIDISDLANPTQFTSHNLAGNPDVRAMTKVGDYVYVARGSIVEAVDVSDLNNISTVGSYSAQDDVYDVSVNAGTSRLFLGTDYILEEFQVVDISDPTNMTNVNGLTIWGSYRINGVAYNPDLDVVVAVSNSNSAEVILYTP